MRKGEQQPEAVSGVNWEELERWGIVALRKHEFNLDEYAAWLADGSLEYNKWAIHPFTNEPLPWSVTSIVRMTIEKLFEADRDARELIFEPIVIVFKDKASKMHFDQMAEQNAIF